MTGKVRWRWWLAVAGIAAAAALALREVRQTRAARAFPAGRPNFLVIDIDVLSWDHVGVVRDGRSNTPNIDALARRGVRFTQAYAHSGWTIPSLATVLAGTLPIPPRAEGDRVPWLPTGARTFPEILSIYGYDTHAFFGEQVALGDAFRSRFNRVHKLPPSSSGSPPEPPTQDVLAYLETAQEPFLAFVHDANIHTLWLYNRPSEDDLVPPDDGPPGIYTRVYRDLAAKHGVETARDAVIRHYDRMAGYYDEAVGRVLERLASSGRAENTVVILTSDHGDDFFEHADVSHGLLYDSTVHVPLIVYDPNAPLHGAETSTVVQLSDLAPTLLARAGIPVDVRMDGRSLLPLLGDDGAPYEERPVLRLTSACHASLRAEGHKFILRNEGGSDEWYPAGGTSGAHVSVPELLTRAGVPDLPIRKCYGMNPDGTLRTVQAELYDLIADPHERVNIVQSEPSTALRMLSTLLTLLDARKKAAATAQPVSMSPAAVNAMRTQGYWDHVTAGDGSPARDAKPPPPPPPPGNTEE